MYFEWYYFVHVLKKCILCNKSSQISIIDLGIRLKKTQNQLKILRHKWSNKIQFFGGRI